MAEEANTEKKEDRVLIRAVNLEKEYRLGRVTIHALRGVNLKVYRGEFLAVTGASGSGKTTLLNMLGGLDRPARGRVVIDGFDLTRAPEGELTSFRLRKVGFVFQSHNLIPVLTAFENVELPMILAGVDKATRIRRAKELLANLGLADRMDHRPDELSGGEQQRVAIARALANRPLIVLADEPTGDLDWETGEQVVKIMKEAVEREKGTLVMATHNREFAGYADRRVELRSGKIIKIHSQNEGKTLFTYNIHHGSVNQKRKGRRGTTSAENPVGEAWNEKAEHGCNRFIHPYGGGYSRRRPILPGQRLCRNHVYRAVHRSNRRRAPRPCKHDGQPHPLRSPTLPAALRIHPLLPRGS